MLEIEGVLKKWKVLKKSLNLDYNKSRGLLTETFEIGGMRDILY